MSTIKRTFDADFQNRPAVEGGATEYLVSGIYVWAIGGEPTPEEVTAFLAPGDTSHINGGKLIRFTGVAPVTILENTGLASATRITKGRYRVSFGTALPTASYSIIPAYFDTINIRAIRPTARTDTYAEVKVTDLAGVAQDVAEITVEIKTVVT